MNTTCRVPREACKSRRRRLRSGVRAQVVCRMKNVLFFANLRSAADAKLLRSDAAHPCQGPFFPGYTTPLRKQSP